MRLLVVLGDEAELRQQREVVRRASPEVIPRVARPREDAVASEITQADCTTASTASRNSSTFEHCRAQ